MTSLHQLSTASLWPNRVLFGFYKGFSEMTHNIIFVLITSDESNIRSHMPPPLSIILVSTPCFWHQTGWFLLLKSINITYCCSILCLTPLQRTVTVWPWFLNMSGLNRGTGCGPARLWHKISRGETKHWGSEHLLLIASFKKETDTVLCPFVFAKQNVSPSFPLAKLQGMCAAI